MKHIAIFALLLCCALPLRAQNTADGLKFGIFDLEHPAFGISRQVGVLSPHLRFIVDADLIISDNYWLTTDLSLRYFARPQRKARGYFGGGLGVALGDDNAIPAHLIGGVDFSVDRLPLFIELKLHLGKPDAATLWFGLRF